MKNLARIIAFYLPQFHPIPENDEWWGKGFTEWTNTAKARPLFRGHYQPHIPADLGFYDLRCPETRIAQAEMANQYGIEGFCYYHYWFGGKEILERPFREVLESGEPNYPFCLCWANETWTGIWHGCPNRILIEQSYPGYQDYVNHFKTLLKAFLDQRYITVDGKPLFLIHRPWEIPDIRRVAEFWKEMAIKSGLKGIYLVGIHRSHDVIPQEHGFDAFVTLRSPNKVPWVPRRKPIKWLFNQLMIKYRKVSGKPTVYQYKKVFLKMISERIPNVASYPCLVPNWDNSPRCNSDALVLHDSTPELFRIQLKRALEIMGDIRLEDKIIFVKSWNEWAEGNHLEPDLRFGKAYLQVIKDEILKEVID